MKKIRVYLIVGLLVLALSGAALASDFSRMLELVYSNNTDKAWRMLLDRDDLSIEQRFSAEFSYAFLMISTENDVDAMCRVVKKYIECDNFNARVMNTNGSWEVVSTITPYIILGQIAFDAMELETSRLFFEIAALRYIDHYEKTGKFLKILGDVDLGYISNRIRDIDILMGKK